MNPYSRSKQQAEEAERQLQRIAQLEASGLARAPSQKIRLERALSDLIERKERGQRSQATINIVIQKSKHLFAFFGPDRDTATIGDDQVEEYVSWALGSGRDPASIERETRHLSVGGTGLEPMTFAL